MDPGLMGARILIVDDEEIVIKSCLRILGGGDYYVEVAHDGREALRKIEENHYDVMILDVVMPNMPGLVGSSVTPSAAQSMRASPLLRSRLPSAPAIHHGVACIIPTVGRNMPPKPIVPSYESMAS